MSEIVVTINIVGRGFFMNKIIYICMMHTYISSFHLHRWLTKDFRSEGRLSIGSTGHKNMYIGVGLGGSSLDAKGGIVGGTIELSKIDTYSEYMVHLCCSIISLQC
jgi:hypothetical protein